MCQQKKLESSGRNYCSHEHIFMVVFRVHVEIRKHYVECDNVDVVIVKMFLRRFLNIFSIKIQSENDWKHIRIIFRVKVKRLPCYLWIDLKSSLCHHWLTGVLKLALCRVFWDKCQRICFVISLLRSSPMWRLQILMLWTWQLLYYWQTTIAQTFWQKLILLVSVKIQQNFICPLVVTQTGLQICLWITS